MVSSESSIEALDIRLRRLEYAFNGTSLPDPLDKTHGPSIPSQISSLNDRLTKLANQNKSIKRLLQACTHTHTLINSR
jgi:hypothetical protein